MRVLASCSLGGAGHLGPLLPFLGAARRRGDDALVVGPAALGDMAARAGVSFVAGGEPAEADVAPIREQLPVLPPREASVLGNRDLFGRLAASALLPAVERVCADWRPDVVLRDPCEYASAVVAPRRGVPTAQVAISLAEAEDSSIAAAAPALDEHRHGLADELRATPYLTRFPASFDPSPFPVTVRYRTDDPTASRLPDWWGGSDAPLVYVTFGTVLGHMTIATDVYRTVLRAVAGLDARVLLTVGHAVDPARLGPLPGHVHVERWVDQADALAPSDLVVCHGGSGTVLGALAAGVPMVVAPLFADQHENARRIAAAGAGRRVALAVRPSGDDVAVAADAGAAAIAEAVESVLATDAQRAHARRLADEMAASPSVAEVLDAVAGG
jgi:hypothetical protein